MALSFTHGSLSICPTYGFCSIILIDLRQIIRNSYIGPWNSSQNCFRLFLSNIELFHLIYRKCKIFRFLINNFASSKANHFEIYTQSFTNNTQVKLFLFFYFTRPLLICPLLSLIFVFHLVDFWRTFRILSPIDRLQWKTLFFFFDKKYWKCGCFWH